MHIELNTKKDSRHLHCGVDGRFLSDEAVAAFKTSLFASHAVRKRTLFIDITTIDSAAHATDKIIYAFEAKVEFERFVADTGIPSRIAICGAEPFISTYRPAHDFFETNGLPIRVFLDRDEALSWLDEEYA